MNKKYSIRRFIVRVLKVVKYLTIFLLLLVLLLSTPFVQTRMGGYATNYINKNFGTNILVKKIDLSLLSNIQLKGIEIRDHHKDTLIFVDNFKTSLLNVKNVLDNKVNLEKASLSGVQFYLKTYKGEKNDNLSIFINSFNTKSQKDSLSSPFVMKCKGVFLSNLAFRFLDQNQKKTLQFAATNTSADFNEFSIIGSDVSMKIRNMKFIDNRGLDIQKLNTDFLYTKTHMQFYKTLIETNNHTRINTDIKLSYKREELVDFNDKVKIKAKFHKSDLSVIDLNKLYKELQGNDMIKFSGKVNGVLNNFSTNNVRMRSKKGLRIDGDFGFVNALNIERGFIFDGEIKNITSNYYQLKRVLPNLLGRTLPTEFQRLGNFTMAGLVKVTPDQMDATLTVNSDIGTTISDLQLTNIENIDNANYEGEVVFDDFDIGVFANDPLLGKISLSADVKGSGFNIDNINTSILGTISSLEFNQYDFNDLNVNGLFKKRKFEGELDSSDDNFLMSFKGLADFSSEINKFDFEVNMTKVNLNKINLFKKDSVSELKGKLVLDISGNTIDDIIGKATFENFKYQNQRDSYKFQKFIINSSIKDSIKSIAINSKDIVEGRLEGKFSFKDLLPITQNALGSIYTNYEPHKVSGDQFLKFDFKLHNKIIDVFFPEIFVEENSHIKGRVNFSNNSIKMSFLSPKIRANENVIEKIVLKLDNKNPIFNTHLTADKISLGNYKIEKLNLLNRTERDTLFFKSEFKAGKSKRENLELNLYYTINKDKKGVLGIQKSKLSYQGFDWVVNPNENKENKITFNIQNKKVLVSPFLLESGDQKIEFQGSTLGAFDKDFKVRFQNVKLASMLPSIDSLKLNGNINGGLTYKQSKEKINPKAYVTVNDFKINGFQQGDLTLQITGDNSYDKFDLNMSLSNEKAESISAEGSLDFSPKRPEIDLQVLLQEYELNAFSPLGKEVLSHLRGKISGGFNARGIISNPDFDGVLRLDDAGLKFPYLNVDFDLKGNTEIILEGQQFKLNDVVLEDTKYKTKGGLKGYIAHQNFEMWFLDLDITTENLLILDTKESEEISYYGTGFLKGDAEITGLTSNLDIEVTGKTQPGTNFVIPLSDIKTVDNYKLIHFEKRVNEKEEKERLIEDIKGLDLRIKLDVTKDAVAQVVIDKVSGSELKGSGQGNLSIDINTRGKFNMVGDFKVDNGLYNFRYAGITKPFVVQKGGTISWSGNPFDAELDITAVYSTKANPAQILDNISSSRKIPIDLYTKITGGLFSSKQEFDIKIPSANSTTSSELEFILNENDLNTKMQHFSFLLAFGTFYNEENIANSATTGLTGTASEIASGILSNMLNGEDDKVRLGVGYVQGDRGNIENQNTSNDQLDVSISTQLSDRVLINGKVGLPVGANNQTNIIGEVEVEGLINDEGNLRWTIFNRPNNLQYSIYEEGYTQGAGISYQVNFNNLNELSQKLGLKKKSKRKKDTIIKKQKNHVHFKSKKTN
ncbi:MAG TPA: DUF490 domain-containing protein [Tenacibaculum sp.]|nr:DUF490 domain-containing protein [Tenacibaculum sp.]